jgi:translation initiation factor RLI1
VPLQVTTLSGGELQRVAITLALGKPADIYLIDEPSAYLDSEQRLIAAKVVMRVRHGVLADCATQVLKRFILHAKKTAFVVEHDFIMATYLADRVIVYEGSFVLCALESSHGSQEHLQSRPLPTLRRHCSRVRMSCLSLCRSHSPD